MACFRSMLCSSRFRRLPSRCSTHAPRSCSSSDTSIAGSSSVLPVESFGNSKQDLFIPQLRNIRSFHFFTAADIPSNDLLRMNRIKIFPHLNRIDDLSQGSHRFMSSSPGEIIEITVPHMGESVRDGTIASFLKQEGDRVEVDDVIAQIETDKVTIDVRSTESGIIEKLAVKEGDTVTPGTVVASVAKGAAQAKSAEVQTRSTSAEATVETKKMDEPQVVSAPPPPKPTPSPPVARPLTQATEPTLPPKDKERRVAMTRLRKRVATRLKDSQNTFALLTTFNEVDMTNLIELRTQYKDKFEERHGVKLGFMSCFVKAAVSALQEQPVVNAVIDGDDIIYRDYVDISIAVGTQKGLVVPVIRGADTMNFAEVEKTINSLAVKANNGLISIDEMAGGTFTISNGGVYGSLLSTPIINPPQSAILGMHTIQKRPMVINNTIVARPMMFIALTYDHRLIDGREAVFFLRRVKDVIEDPRRLLLDV